MLMKTVFTMATFTAPENIGTTPLSMLWLIPLAAAIAIVYKATKLPTIKASIFLKEVAVLSSTIIIVMAIIALALCILGWLITQ